MLLVCVLGVRLRAEGRAARAAAIYSRRVQGLVAPKERGSESGGAPAARTASAICRCGAADEWLQSGFDGHSSTAKGALEGDSSETERANRGFRRREVELSVWPRGGERWFVAAGMRMLEVRSWRCWCRDLGLKVFVGAVVGTRCCRSAGKMRVFEACDGGSTHLAQRREVEGVRGAAEGNGEVGVPAVSMARRRVDRLRAANIAASPWKFARKLARPPDCVRNACQKIGCFRPY